MSKTLRALRRACWTACADPSTGLQNNSFPALAARFAASAAPAESRTYCNSAQLFSSDSTGDPGRADAANSRNRSGLPCTGGGHDKRGSAPQQARMLWAAGSLSHTPWHSCRSFSAQPLPAKHMDGPEPLGFVKGGYSVEQFPPDKVSPQVSIGHDAGASWLRAATSSHHSLQGAVTRKIALPLTHRHGLESIGVGDVMLVRSRQAKKLHCSNYQRSQRCVEGSIMPGVGGLTG